MLANKNDPTNVKMIDFGLSKDFSGQETMKTMSGSVSEWNLDTQYHPIWLSQFFVAILYCPWGFPPKLQFEDWRLVAGCRALHYALGQGAVSGKFRARNYRQCYQRWFSFQSWAILTTQPLSQRIPSMSHQEGRLAAIFSGVGIQPSLDPESLTIVPRTYPFGGWRHRKYH